MFYESGYHQIWNSIRRRKPAPVEYVPEKLLAWRGRQQTHVAFYGIVSHLNLIERAAQNLQPHYDALQQIRAENAGRATLRDVGVFVDARNKIVAEYALRDCDIEQVGAFCIETAKESQLYDRTEDEIRGKE